MHHCLSFDVRDQINVCTILQAMCMQISICPKVWACPQSLASMCDSPNKQDFYLHCTDRCKKQHNIWVGGVKCEVVRMSLTPTEARHWLTLTFFSCVSCIICHWSCVQWCLHMENTMMRSPESLSQMD